MKNNPKPKFSWDEETGVSTCILSDNKNVYVGTAKCCDYDRDMMNEKTGCEIALKRATINYYKSIRDHELIPALRALKGVAFTLKNCNQNFESQQIVQRQINRINTDLNLIRGLIFEEQESLNDYLVAKDTFYKQIRANREKGQK